MKKPLPPLHEVRVANLRALVAKAGSQAKLARKHNLDATYISQLLNGYRTFGERSARNIESLLKLPTLYLDKDHNADNKIEIDQSNLWFYYSNLDPEHQAIIKQLIQALWRPSDR